MSGFSTIQLGEVTTKVGSGSTPRGGEAAYKSTGTPLIRSMNVHFGGFREDGLAHIDDDQAAALRNVEVRARDVLLNITGASIGRVTIAPPHMDGARVNQHVCIIRPDDRLEPSFLRWFLASPHEQRLINSMESGATRQALTKEKILAFEVPLPSLDGQREIVAELEKQFSRLDEGAANLQRVKANLKRYKASVLKAAVEGRLVETEATQARREGRIYETGEQLLQRILEERRAKWAGRGSFSPEAASDALDVVPEGWVAASIDELATVVRGGSPRPAGDPRYFGGPVPWITVGSITADETDYLRHANGGLTEEGKERSRFIEEHTLLLTNSGATLGVPKISLIAGCINDGVAALLDVEYPLKHYLVHYLRTKTDALRQVNQGAAQPNLNTTIIKAMVAPLPPVAEQARIVAEVDRHLSIIREVEAEVDASLYRAQALRQSTLAKAFSSSSPEHRN